MSGWKHVKDKQMAVSTCVSIGLCMFFCEYTHDDRGEPIFIQLFNFIKFIVVL